MKFTAVILAAGIGSRIESETLVRPKTLVEVNNSSILENQIDLYIGLGAEKIIIVAGYLKDQITKRLADKNFSTQIVVLENRDYRDTNNMYSLYLALKNIDSGPFLFSNGDVVYSKKLFDKIFINENSSSFIVADRNFVSNESMRIAVGEDGKTVTSISKNISKDNFFATSCDLVFICRSDFGKFYEIIEDFISNKGERNLWAEVAIDRLVVERNLGILDITGTSWVEIDTGFDLNLARQRFVDIELLLKDTEIVVLDLDGTITMDGEFIPGAIDFIRFCLESKVLYFCTNNSAFEPDAFIANIKRFDLDILSSQVLCSTTYTLGFLRSKDYKRIGILGSVELKTAIELEGFKTVEKNADLYIIGFSRKIEYSEILEVCIAVSRGIPYVLTNPDLSYPSRLGPIPDAGGLGTLIESVTGIKPIEIFGKPSRNVIGQVLWEHSNVSADKILVVGDRIQTDIRMANNSGTKSVLLLTGATTHKIINMQAVECTAILDSIADLLL